MAKVRIRVKKLAVQSVQPNAHAHARMRQFIEGSTNEINTVKKVRIKRESELHTLHTYKKEGG
jgi:hypothetical protein